MKTFNSLFAPEKSFKMLTDATKEEEAAAENYVNRIQNALDEYTKLDAAAKDYFRTFEMPVQIEKLKDRTFVRLGDQEFVAEYCTDIQVHKLGAPPHADNHIYTNAYAASNAVIIAHMASGREIKFVVNRHALEATFAALQSAHRKALQPTPDEAKS